MEKKSRNLILAIETGIEGGSLAIFDSDRKSIVDGSIGKKEISRAEDLLENLNILLKQSDTQKKSISFVVFGTEIGSSTGLKIGESLSKGLAKGIGCQYLEYSFWEVFGKLPAMENNKKVFYLPAGKNRILVRQWNADNFFSAVYFTDFEGCLADLEKNQNSTIFIHDKLFNEQTKADLPGINYLQKNLAALLAQYASDNEVTLQLSKTI